MKTSLKKPNQKVYYIDQVIIDNDQVSVDYTLNDEWLEITLSLSELKQFTLNRSLNQYCLDYMHGEHIQDAGRIDMDTFLSENLSAIIKAYLEAYPLESVIVQMKVLKTKMNTSKITKVIQMYAPILRRA